MFGDLFEQDQPADKQTFLQSINSEPKKRFIADDMELPPVIRTTEFAGLANKGATCYLNSLFQCLYFNPELRSLILSVDLDSESSSYKKNSDKYRVIKQIQLLFLRLKHSSQKNQSTSVIL